MTKKLLSSVPKSIEWSSRELFFIDQTLLPNEVVIEKQESIEQVWQSIKILKVRGAPAIGIGAAYGLVIGAKTLLNETKSEFLEKLRKQADYLDSSRPTAVNLHWALERMMKVAKETELETATEIFEILVKEAEAIHQEDREICFQIGKNGESLIQDGMGVLTHCNAGALAVSELGTALSPIYSAHQKGVKFKVYADETRPLLQGARLTAWELQQAEVDITLICDNMAAHLMSQGLIQMVIVGTDRVAKNGDVANKIGTLGVAILAKYFNIPFYVACPSSTLDFSTPTGKEIVIEERGEDEVTFFGERRTGPEGIQVRNPAFDVTPNELVTAIITEKGLVSTPYETNLGKLFR
ncbi:MAG: methylthioribose-1-phosphate isomerase [bacterium]|jgi:methylthioribose-1-phosphate isomerase